MDIIKFCADHYETFSMRFRRTRCGHYSAFLSMVKVVDGAGFHRVPFGFGDTVDEAIDHLRRRLLNENLVVDKSEEIITVPSLFYGRKVGAEVEALIDKRYGCSDLRT